MYVLLEGGDGAGKDLQATMLISRLSSRGISNLLVREPWDEKPIGKLLRQFLKTGEYPAAHAALFLADRMALLSEVVKPAIESGTVVISIRSFLSTLVYQQEHQPLQWLKTIHENLPVPITNVFYLDIDPELGAQRRAGRGEAAEVYEKLEIQQRVRQRYHDILADTHYLPLVGTNVQILDASRTPEEVHDDIWREMVIE